MDKKNTLLGIICILAGIGFMVKQTADMREQQSEQLEEERAAEQIRQADLENKDASAWPSEVAEEIEANESAGSALSLLTKSVEPIEAVYSQVEEETITLANDFIEVEFTTAGGAIKTINFLKTKNGERDTYVFNENSFLPALSLGLIGDESNLQSFAVPYTIEEQSANSVTFALNLGEGVTLQRVYSLADSYSEEEPYNIQHKTLLRNQSEAPRVFSTLYFNLGTAHSVSDKQQQTFLNVGYFNGNKAKFTEIGKLMGGGFLSSLGFGSSEPVDKLEKTVRSEWVSVKNQFFASILSSDIPGSELFIYKVDLPDLEDGSEQRPGISASVGYDVGTIAAGSTEALEFDFYVGPKEYKRLQKMDNMQDEVMQFGFLSMISKLLLSFMYLIHTFVPNWGWSIVIMTICIKLLFWPLSAKASRSQKRMAKIQEPMKELKEKYKDSPQKFQKEMLELFKANKVNPVAGCLPMIIQMPIFVGLFYMLRTASELRHESFLWVSDLSMSDTVAHVAGYPLNLLPLIMGITMFYQMRMVPVSPTADPMQQKIFKFLPFIFLIFLYNFSSGLVLYWTVQNLLTVLQQKMINRLPDEIEPTKIVPVNAKGRKGSTGKKSKKKH
ncbi:MAG: YidC/Oxa1 family membrane protein insertase [Zhongshania aliphaticivorans]|jgi:YidC/Oxa1 family membrane protein insertase